MSLNFGEWRTKSEGLLGRVGRGRERSFPYCSVIAVSIDLLLRMTVHFTGHTATVVLRIAISMDVVEGWIRDVRMKLVGL